MLGEMLFGLSMAQVVVIMTMMAFPPPLALISFSAPGPDSVMEEEVDKLPLDAADEAHHEDEPPQDEPGTLGPVAVIEEEVDELPLDAADEADDEDEPPQDEPGTLGPVAAREEEVDELPLDDSNDDEWRNDDCHPDLDWEDRRVFGLE